MTTAPSAQPVRSFSMTKRMLLGAVIGFALIAIFLLGVNNPNPAWPKYWMLRPLIVVPLAGAMGGLFYYLADRYFGYRGGWKKALAIVASIFVYLVGLWMGTVLGLAGTLWN